MFDGVFRKYITPKNVLFISGMLLFAVCVLKMPEIALMFFASFVIACSLKPAADKLSSRFSKNTACTIVLSGALLFACAFLAPVIVIGAHEIKILAASFPQYAVNIKDMLSSSPLMNQVVHQLDLTGIASSASGAAGKIFSHTINAGKNIGSAFVYLLVSILIIYYFMIDGDKIKEALLKFFPKNIRKRAGGIFDIIAVRSGGYITAQLVTMASVGIIISAGLFLMRNEYALILGLISAVFDIVPIAGPAAAFIICMIAVSKSGIAAMIITAVIFAAAQLIENNFVRPYVFGKFLDLHPLVIYLFIFIAAKYMGVSGVIFAPAIAVTAVVLIEEVYMKNME